MNQFIRFSGGNGLLYVPYHAINSIRVTKVTEATGTNEATYSLTVDYGAENYKENYALTETEMYNFMQIMRDSFNTVSL